eukprot:9484797-Pyramimonas_sp.AAC.1
MAAWSSEPRPPKSLILRQIPPRRSHFGRRGEHPQEGQRARPSDGGRQQGHPGDLGHRVELGPGR